MRARNKEEGTANKNGAPEAGCSQGPKRDVGERTKYIGRCKRHIVQARALVLFRSVVKIDESDIC